MYSPCLKFVGFLLLTSLALRVNAQTRELHVCADPNNMPFSSRDQTGFENRIAALVARDLNAHLTFVWQRMGRGFVREYLDKGQCDLLIGIPTYYRPVLTTSPYYRSTYVFVATPAEPAIPSLDSSALHGLKIGVQVLEEEYTPPGEALARRGLQGAIVGFDTTGDGADSIVRAVVDHKVDLAIVWGPLAGYFSKKVGEQLRITPVEPEVDPPGLPLTFAISMGVRKGNLALRDQLEKILSDHATDIRAILDEYGVPQLPLASPADSNGVAN
jgi:mxaJ protein